jgi:hypothetical protein
MKRSAYVASLFTFMEQDILFEVDEDDIKTFMSVRKRQLKQLDK